MSEGHGQDIIIADPTTSSMSMVHTKHSDRPHAHARQMMAMNATIHSYRTVKVALSRYFCCHSSCAPGTNQTFSSYFDTVSSWTKPSRHPHEAAIRLEYGDWRANLALCDPFADIDEMDHLLAIDSPRHCMDRLLHDHEYELAC